MILPNHARAAAVAPIVDTGLYHLTLGVLRHPLPPRGFNCSASAAGLQMHLKWMHHSSSPDYPHSRMAAFGIYWGLLHDSNPEQRPRHFAADSETIFPRF